jgi:NAD dependent epimerase/dehydratase family enzyme
MYAEAASVLIDSKEVYPKALQKAGFIFAYEEINTALQEILI